VPISETPDRRVWREFQGATCPVCGARKRPNNGFCSKCYYSLPKSMQSDLWKRFGSGYEEAHEDARDWLEQERRAQA
jgi:hypothetical protein